MKPDTKALIRLLDDINGKPTATARKAIDKARSRRSQASRH
ncbi:MAG: hypothetical protein Q8N96_02135 [Methylovulum sp.]|nr:hypothetical protein [Methylovulum sp.]